MKYQRSFRLPVDPKTTSALVKARDKKPGFLLLRSRGPSIKRPIYTPNKKTLAKQKAKITLPKLTLPD